MSHGTIAALYVDPSGIYANLPDVEVWDEVRDARLYDGPYPVVAHPPCARWSTLAYLVQAVHGYKVGDDEGCFEAALTAVRNWGGVLEHPAKTLAWREYGLARPRRGYWRRSLLDDGYVTEISQAAYGLDVRKRTWLYYVGAEPPALNWSEPETVKIVSDLGPGGSRKRGEDWEPGVQYAEASATPLSFRDVLLDLARSSVRNELAAVGGDPE